MEQNKRQLYLALMTTIQRRLQVINTISDIPNKNFWHAETAAFHGRKILEGVAFACLVAVENGLKHVPRDAKGQWNAEVILKRLRDKKIATLPSPSIIRDATLAEHKSENVNIVIEGVPERRLSHDDLIAAYQRMHGWLHELNPYTEIDHMEFFAKNGQSLWDDLSRINRFVEKHFISISGKGFFCVLRDDMDGLTKVLPLSRAST